MHGKTVYKFGQTKRSRTNSKGKKEGEIIGEAIGEVERQSIAFQGKWYLNRYGKGAKEPEELEEGHSEQRNSQCKSPEIRKPVRFRWQPCWLGWNDPGKHSLLEYLTKSLGLFSKFDSQTLSSRKR